MNWIKTSDFNPKEAVFFHDYFLPFLTHIFFHKKPVYKKLQTLKFEIGRQTFDTALKHSRNLNLI